MRVKTFRGKSTSVLFAEIKAEFGDSAIILSNKTVDEGGRKIHEIMVGVDTQKETPAQPSKPAPQEEFISDVMGKTPDWSQEWNQIKGHMMALLKPQMNLNILAPRQKLALEYLEREGVCSNVILDIFQKLRLDTSQPVLPTLEKIVKINPRDPSGQKEKFQALAGPNGVGKTTTIIRLALQAKKRNPSAKICVASADQGHGQGRLILKHYADLSGFDFKELTSREDFAHLKGDSHKYDKIFIDLPTMTREANLDSWLGVCGMNGGCSLAVHLVLTPYFAPEQYRYFIKRYKTPELKSIIWTKLDEACSYGSLINIAHDTDLPVSLLSFGSSLKNSIKPASTKDFWRLIFKHQLPQKEEQSFAKAI